MRVKTMKMLLANLKGKKLPSETTSVSNHYGDQLNRINITDALQIIGDLAEFLEENGFAIVIAIGNKNLTKS